MFDLKLILLKSDFIKAHKKVVMPRVVWMVRQYIHHPYHSYERSSMDIAIPPIDTRLTAQIGEEQEVQYIIRISLQLYKLFRTSTTFV